MRAFASGGLRALASSGLLAALWLVGPSVAAAQTDSIDDQYETWFGGFFAGPVTGDVWTHSDVHYRVYDDFSPRWVLLRPGLSLRLMDGMFATVGYAWTPSWGARGAERFTDEHRAWEQWMWELTEPGSGMRFQIRTRLEERFRSEREVGMRLRQMVRLAVPVSDDRNWLLVLWDEVFFDLNDTTVTTYQHQGFGQNRLFVGVGYQAVPGTLRFEFGYFNQFIRRPGDPNGDLDNHTVMLNTYVGWR